MNETLEYHPLADLFPLMEGDDYKRFKDDISVRGLLHPIIILDERILDGRNRYRACKDTGRPIRTESYHGDDPAGFVIASNLHRRHLNESQRAMVAAALSTMQQGDNQHTQICGTSQNEAASKLNVSPRSVQHAGKVRKRGSSKLRTAVEQGKIAVSTGAKLADLPTEVQDQAAADPDKAKHLAKQHQRAQRESDLAAATLAASQRVGTQLYGVIYADPPWRFEPYSRDTGMDRAADNHYPTITLSDIKALRPPVADDAVLFLWATVPMLPQAFDVMAAWGFTYKSHAIWLKDKAGTGYWFRNRHELLLVGTRGDIPAPAPGEQYDSVIPAQVREHSVKPFHFTEMIEEMFPNQPRLEMFARGEAIAGWDRWGNEVRPILEEIDS
jgi:N6-adenosine-specific RNA methylase IME4